MKFFILISFAVAAYGYYQQRVEYIPTDSNGARQCPSYGRKICATDFYEYALFENACRLEEHNLKRLFLGKSEMVETSSHFCKQGYESYNHHAAAYSSYSPSFDYAFSNLDSHYQQQHYNPYTSISRSYSTPQYGYSPVYYGPGYNAYYNPGSFYGAQSYPSHGYGASQYYSYPTAFYNSHYGSVYNQTTTPVPVTTSTMKPTTIPPP